MEEKSCLICRGVAKMKLLYCNHSFCYICCLKMKRCKLCYAKIDLLEFETGKLKGETVQNCNWNSISRNMKLTEEFMDIFKYYLNWDYVSVYQTLSEEFIEKHTTRVNWKSITQYQTMSLKFVKKHILKLDKSKLQNYKEIELLCKRLFH